MTLLLAGDVMTGRGIDQLLHHPSTPGLYEHGVKDARDYVHLAEQRAGHISTPVAADYIWGDALSHLERVKPDLRIVNLETAVTTAEQAWPGKHTRYRMHPQNIDCLNAAHIDCCVMANNHAMDWGRSGLDESLQTLQTAAIATAGAGLDGDAAWDPALLPLAGGANLLVFSCCTASSGVPPGWSAAPKRSGIALLPDLSETTARLFADDVARRRGPRDLVVVSLHWGANSGLEVPVSHRAFARRLIDLGAADVVHGHSSHRPMPLEVYRGKPIIYGCGDLINDSEGIRSQSELRRDVRCLYFVTLARAGGQLRRLEIVPLQSRRFRLGTADANARDWVAEVLTHTDNQLQLQPLAGDLRLQGWTVQWGDTG